MNKIIKLTIFCILACAPLACTDYLDVRPENQILLEQYWQKGSDVEASVLACYRAMQEDDYMQRVICWGELRSDNMIPASNADDYLRDASNANILPTNNLSQWKQFYTVINYCNTVLKFSGDVLNRDANFKEADLQARSAEVLALRALSYFYLVRTFRDVPLVLEATVDDTQVLEVPQTSPGEVLEQIVKDLLQAEQWALNEYPSVPQTKGRITKDAARAILADVYLWQKKYTDCIEYCDKLINAVAITPEYLAGSSQPLPKYQLIEQSASGYPPYRYIFYEERSNYRGNSSESIFELQFNNEKFNEGVRKFYGTGISTYGQLNANTTYGSDEIVFPKTDQRKGFCMNLVPSSSGAYNILKYWRYEIPEGTGYYYYYWSTTANWIFYRITDIMLMKAEALVQLNRSENDLLDALHIVNTTYMRANPTLLEADSLSFQNYNDPNTLDHLVLLERQRELMFEGKRWFDLLRRTERKNSPDDLVNFVALKYTSNLSTIIAKLSVMNALYMPINADELKANQRLIQNPYYITTSNKEK